MTTEEKRTMSDALEKRDAQIAGLEAELAQAKAFISTRFYPPGDPSVEVADMLLKLDAELTLAKEEVSNLRAQISTGDVRPFVPNPEEVNRVVELRLLRELLENAELELTTRRRDDADAAGELLFTIPSPGTAAAKLLSANRSLKSQLAAADRLAREIDEARNETATQLRAARQDAGRCADGRVHDAEHRDAVIDRVLGELDQIFFVAPECWGDKVKEIKAALAEAKSAAGSGDLAPRDVDQVIDYLKSGTERSAAIFVQGLEAVEELILASDCVDGLHLNGDLAPWAQLRIGGEFEQWLEPFDRALAELRKPADEERGCFNPDGSVRIEEVPMEPAGCYCTMIHGQRFLCEQCTEQGIADAVAVAVAREKEKAGGP